MKVGLRFFFNFLDTHLGLLLLNKGKQINKRIFTFLF